MCGFCFSCCFLHVLRFDYFGWKHQSNALHVPLPLCTQGCILPGNENIWTTTAATWSLGWELLIYFLVWLLLQNTLSFHSVCNRQAEIYIYYTTLYIYILFTKIYDDLLFTILNFQEEKNLCRTYLTLCLTSPNF